MENLFTKKIEIKNEREVKLFVLEVLCISCLTLVFDLTVRFDSWWGYRLSFVAVYWVLGLTAFFFYFKLFKGKRENVSVTIRSIIVGVLLVVPSYLGKLLVIDIPRGHILPEGYALTDVKNTVWYIFFYIFIVGITEEFIFRVCAQNQLERLLGKANFLSPLFSAVLFGAWHLIFGWPEQAIITFVVGLVLGYAKKYIKACNYISVVTAHGLYDILVSFVLF
ncbi:MAG: CPBP family intramembrane glutamic endopeptidase [Wujia sp.]